MSGSVVTLEKLLRTVVEVVGYGQVGFTDALSSLNYDIDDSETMKNWKVKKTRFSKKIIKEIVDFRKADLVKRGYTER